MTIAAPGDVRALLRGAIDYAGLFPPAALPMTEALADYARYRRSDDAWALGRFVVPAGRLGEALAGLPALGEAGRGWAFSVTLAADLSDGPQLAPAAPALSAAGAEIASLEGRAPTPDVVVRLAEAAAGRTWYAEVDLLGDFDPVLDAIRDRGGRAKVRLGGVTVAAFPSSARVAAFLAGVARRKLAFKGTAGLHHPVRGEYRLTYEDDAPLGVMFGYLNLAVAAVLAAGGAPPAEIEAALLESHPAQLLATGGGLAWRAQPLPTAAVPGLRAWFDGFGSCSFREPIDDLNHLLGS
ncbi:MAG: hypothetical protein AB7L66_14655 [Gemmatimonadales bacterium]